MVICKFRAYYALHSDSVKMTIFNNGKVTAIWHGMAFVILKNTITTLIAHERFAKYNLSKSCNCICTVL